MLDAALRPDHAWIAAHIPHQGRMCLLDHVLAWDAQQICCAASSHSAPDHPLRDGGRLGISIGIEYAAQAMAVHGVLLAGNGQRQSMGYLASVRGVRTHVQRLDDQAGWLHVNAARLSGDASLILYQFNLTAQGRCLIEGRATVVLDANRP